MRAFIHRPAPKQTADLVRSTKSESVAPYSKRGGSHEASATISRRGFDFTRIPVRHTTSERLQTKLTVNIPGDVHEQEADRVADQVMRMPEPQRQGAYAWGGDCQKCQNEQRWDKHRMESILAGKSSGTAMSPAAGYSSARPSGSTAGRVVKPLAGSPAKRARGEDQTLAIDAHISPPPKLTKSDVKTPIGRPCGGFSWWIAWALDKESTQGGLIVQKVDSKYGEIKDCNGNPFLMPKEKFDPAWYPFWEAWEIDKNMKVTSYGSYDDKYETDIKIDKTKGSFTISGTAQFYEGARLADADFRVMHGPPAGDLPMTKSDPHLKGGTGAISHNLEATWDCCSVVSTKDTKVKVG